MKTFGLAIAFCIFAARAAAQSPADDSTIRAILAAQVVEWNKGNIAGYMRGYWPNDSLLFIGKGGPSYGYATTLTRYIRAYPDAARMGTLTSTVLSLRVLSPDWAYVTGRWELKRSAGDLSGYYTLLWRRIGGEWMIVEDHSS